MVAHKFVCDEMLQGLGRWLRAAGYDTLIASNGEHDAALLRLARREGRLFVTRDRALLATHRHLADLIILLAANDMPACAAELTRRCDLDWCKAPFSRCLLCNTPLQVLRAGQRELVDDQVPDDVGSTGRPVLYCPACRKAYWEGGHVRRMRARLQGFQRGEWQ
ncbi:hypothetical protein Tel_03085 [Candidatus Tenderia electrophaga]|jgi:hypothetical protein|uniref:Mut7-C RNAse domain-containing protein n=1 Tax=Candidatus Tenderia electrophaga TaxID=1748243 RepID=A0A0S2TAR4_9GAMM|nr:hypothetical protein Tel_03085 [Candidatus Tenderia electrophaga]